MQNPSAGGPTGRRAPGPFVGGRPMPSSLPAASARPRPFAPGASRNPPAVTSQALVMQAPEMPAMAAEAVEQAALPLDVPAPPAEAVEQVTLPLVMPAPADDAVQQDTIPVESTVAPEPAEPVTDAVPDPFDAPHWAMATYDEGMTVDDALAEPSLIVAATPEDTSLHAERAAVILESVAASLRRGEIHLAAGASGSSTDAAVLAAVLSALLRTHR